MTARRSLLAVLATALLLVAGCSTSGGSDDDASTTTKPEAASTTVADDGGDVDETTTTEADDGGDDEPSDGPTKDDLEALLPTAADVGDGWEVAPADEESESDEGDEAIEEQCPEAAALAGDQDDEDENEVSRSFTTADGQEVEVELSADAETIDEDELSALVDAINACGDISIDGGDGSTTTFTFDATVDGDYGDQGIRLQANVVLEVPELGDPIELTLYALTYRDGSVGVNITGVDGLDEDTFEAVPFDPELLIGLADGIDAQLADLTGG